MTIKDDDVDKMLQRLMTSTGLQLKVEENESGFTLLLMDGNRVKEMLPDSEALLPRKPHRSILFNATSVGFIGLKYIIS